MYKLKIDKPNLIPGTELEIPGLGIYKNGKEYDISDEQAEAFRYHHSRVVTETDPSGDLGTYSVGTELGPTLLQAFESDDGIIVTATKQAKSSSQTEPEEQDQPELPRTPSEPENVEIAAPDAGTVNERSES